MSELKINKGIELMLRRSKRKEDKKEEKPTTGFIIKQNITLLQRKVYFNFGIWWEKKNTSSELNND
tara:strand:+ start:958 stop:1155 length:198 start_codon:yes stop_codon:yes gene_type:complete